jgi:hypothetical protein
VPKLLGLPLADGAGDVVLSGVPKLLGLPLADEAGDVVFSGVPEGPELLFPPLAGVASDVPGPASGESRKDKRVYKQKNGPRRKLKTLTTGSFRFGKVPSTLALEWGVNTLSKKKHYQRTVMSSKAQRGTLVPSGTGLGNLRANCQTR